MASLVHRTRTGPLGQLVGGFSSAVAAVSIKELRGRMRGRRAFAVLTLYLALLSVFAWAIFQFQSVTQGGQDLVPGLGSGVGSGRGSLTAATAIALSAQVGQSIFGGLILLETLLVMVLAPAFTSGAISLEREKGTLDLLVTTPLSTLGMVIGKLFSALIYVLLLIVASIPLASLVFTFGGVSPDDLLRAYVLLFAVAFGMGAIGLFFSALVRRTQVATVLTYITVLALTLGSFGVFRFWYGVASGGGQFGGQVSVAKPPPQQLLWLNPIIADIDLVCGTATDGYADTCAIVGWVTNRPYFGSFSNSSGVDPGFGVDLPGGVALPGCRGDDCPPERPVGQVAPVVDAFAFPRDSFWPRTALAYSGLGLVLTLLAAQLVTPSRRLRILRPMAWRRRGRAAPAVATEPDQSTISAPADEVTG
jgi:ABC-type transport system involved in multi-copper enzyme maturation permease subunit